MTQRRSKYNTPTRKRDKPRAFGVTFDSKLECQRAMFLKAEEAAGRISVLEFHPPFVLLGPFEDAWGEKHRAVRYVADFAYTYQGREIVEDVKGGKATQTPIFRLKRKLFCRRYPHLRHVIVTAATEPPGGKGR
jgi:hypothetical protein